MNCRGADISRGFSPSMCIAGYEFIQNMLRFAPKLEKPSLSSVQKVEKQREIRFFQLSVECFAFHYFQVRQKINVSFLFKFAQLPHYRVLSMLSLLSARPRVLRKLKPMTTVKLKRDCGRAEMWRGAVSGQGCLQDQGLIYHNVHLQLQVLCVSFPSSSSRCFEWEQNKVVSQSSLLLLERGQ